MNFRDKLKDCKKIVLKVGTSTLTYSNGQLNLQRIEKISRQLADLHNQGLEVLLVTSGAIGVGASKMGYKNVPKTIPEKQALAAIGQGALLHIYEKVFAEYGKIVAQVLLSREDLDERMRYLNATNTLLAILKMKAIPIINENDTVAVEEIKFGDNDTLSAMVAALVDADLLIILSDVEGLYDCDPRNNEQACLQSEIYEISEDMENNSRNRGTHFSSGGMLTKLKAAKICMLSSVPMVIANSSHENVIRRIVEGENLGTLFMPREEKMDARKKWIAFGTVVHGRVFIDSGAEQALLKKGRSLLPSGIIKVEGDFDRGMVVEVLTSDNREIARGIINYDARESKMIAGRKTAEIEKILGEKDYDEVIHRNNLWIIN